MDVQRVIDDIEQLQEMFGAPDIRPLSASDIAAANRKHGIEGCGNFGCNHLFATTGPSQEAISLRAKEYSEQLANLQDYHQMMVQQIAAQLAQLEIIALRAIAQRGR